MNRVQAYYAKQKTLPPPNIDIAECMAALQPRQRSRPLLRAHAPRRPQRSLRRSSVKQSRTSGPTGAFAAPPPPWTTATPSAPSTFLCRFARLSQQPRRAQGRRRRICARGPCQRGAGHLQNHSHGRRHGRRLRRRNRRRARSQRPEPGRTLAAPGACPLPARSRRTRTCRPLRAGPRR